MPFASTRMRSGTLGRVVAPPYDVIGDDLHRALLERHPRNAVRLDLPEALPARGPRRALPAGRADAVGVALGRHPAQGQPALDLRLRAGLPRPRHGPRADPARLLRPAADRAVRPREPRPAPRAHAVRAQGGSLPPPARDRRSTRSPVVGLFRDPDGEAAGVAGPGRRGDAGGRPDRRRRRAPPPVGRPGRRRGIRRRRAAAGRGRGAGVDRRRPPPLRDRGPLPRRAPGWLRGDGPRVRLPADAVPGRRRAAHRPADPPGPARARRRRRGRAGRAAAGAVRRDPVDPGRRSSRGSRRPGELAGGEGRFGLLTRAGAWLLEAKRGAFASLPASGGPAVRELDVTRLGTALEQLAGIDAAAVAAGDRIRYTKSASEARSLVEQGTDGADAAFLLEPTPVASILDVAAEGDVMPQKSTYFYPKALTGLVLNPHEW